MTRARRQRPVFVWRQRRRGVRAGREAEFRAMLDALNGPPLSDSDRARMLADLDAALRPRQGRREGGAVMRRRLVGTYRIRRRPAPRVRPARRIPDLNAILAVLDAPVSDEQRAAAEALWLHGTPHPQLSLF